MKRVRMEVAPYKGRWRVTQGSMVVFNHDTQRDAIEAARLLVDCLLLEGKTVTLKIKRPNGQVREERTYPRSSDPRKTKG